MTKQIFLSLLNCSWQWVLLGGLTWFITGSVFRKKRRSNTTVHLLWLLSLLSLPILFGLNQFVPALSIGGNPVSELIQVELTQVEPVNMSGLTVPATDLPQVSSVGSDTQTGNQRLTADKSFFSWETKTELLLGIWAIGAFTMLVRFVFGLCRIYQLRRNAVVADDSYQAICRGLARQLDIKRTVTVCISDRIASPISFGWLSPSILIPRKLNLEQFELVAAHELAHLQRLDWLTTLFSHVVGVVFFFHPIYYFLNRELVRLRERICDDWVIRLTGARKNYAQCLLDLVRHRDRAIPLALSLNQPSQLESRIDAILKDNRQLDVQLKPRLRLIAATLLLTCLPLLAMAQLVPLKTFQVSLFAQTPEKSEEAVEKQHGQEAKVEKIGEKGDTEDSGIEVEDPTLFDRSEENGIVSGPQPGEKLPPLKVTGIRGGLNGETFDITAKADGKPIILFLQDTDEAGIKGLVQVFEWLKKVGDFEKKQNNASGLEFQIGVVLLTDDADALPESARDVFEKHLPDEIIVGISPDGREGPSSYRLNRDVPQTVLIAKDGQVLHNFAFTEPMRSLGSHFVGTIADTIGIVFVPKPVIINEIDNASDLPDSEWVELRNLNDGELNLKGWRLSAVSPLGDAEWTIQFNEDVKIPANGYLLLDAEIEIDNASDLPEWIELRNLNDNELNLEGWTLGSATTILDDTEWTIQFNEDVKIPANGYLLLDAESVKKLDLTEGGYVVLLRRKGERSPTMEEGDAHNRDQELSLEETIKEVTKDAELIQQLLKQLKEGEGARKRLQELSLEENLKGLAEDAELIQQLLLEQMKEQPKEGEGARKRVQDLSLEETLKELTKELTEDAALIQQLLEQLKEGEGARKRVQDLSLEETIKGLKEDIAQFKERLKQLEEKHKRVFSPKED